MSIQVALDGGYSFFKDPDIALQNYNEYGFHIEKNLVSPEECDYLIQESYNLSAAKANNFKPFMMPHKERPSFVTALKHKRTVEIIDMLVGGNAVALQSQFFYCRPTTRGFSLHQDCFFVQARMGVFASAWNALVDTSPENGGLIVYPGSHLEGLLPVQKLSLGVDVNQDPNANNEETVVPEKYKPCNIKASKGSVVFIHGHVVHGSNPNKSEGNRYILLNTYIKNGEAFRSGNYAQREPMALT